MLRKEIAASKADQLVRLTSQADAPIDLRRAADALDVILIEEDLDDELAGMAFVRSGQRFVISNKRHPNNRRRFTIAHELGHHMLHSDKLIGSVHVDKTVLRRDPNSSTGTDLMEIEANSFAASLLMPASLVQKAVETGFDLENEDQISKLAGSFQVSTAALYYRLLNLELVRA